MRRARAAFGSLRSYQKVLSRISSCMCAGFVNKHRKLRVNHGEIYAAASGPFSLKLLLVLGPTRPT